MKPRAGAGNYFVVSELRMRPHTILTEPVAGPVAWSGRQLGADSAWVDHLTRADVAELDAALAGLPASLPTERIRRGDFHLPGLAARLKGIAHELEDGRGFVVLRGLPAAVYDQTQLARIFWGIGTYLGTAIAQNARGDLVGHVRDEGRTLDDPNARGYQTRAAQSLHVDRCDVVGLLCFQKAKSGGTSRVVSSMTIYNELLRRAPWYVGVLYKPFAIDMRGEQQPGEPPVYYRSVYSYCDGRLSCGCNYTYIRDGQRLIGAPLTPIEIEALDLFYAIAEEQVLGMDLEPGDMQFLNNYVILHDRTAYEDWPQAERQRHMLRLWLDVPKRRPLAPEFGTYRFAHTQAPA